MCLQRQVKGEKEHEILRGETGGANFKTPGTFPIEIRLTYRRKTAAPSKAEKKGLLQKKRKNGNLTQNGQIGQGKPTKPPHQKTQVVEKTKGAWPQQQKQEQRDCSGYMWGHIYRAAELYRGSAYRPLSNLHRGSKKKKLNQPWLTNRKKNCRSG